jgi:hypothetical protein
MVRHTVERRSAMRLGSRMGKVRRRRESELCLSSATDKGECTWGRRECVGIIRKTVECSVDGDP